jgi:hypothetical protein
VRGRGAADGRVSVGGEAAKRRVHGGVELAGVDGAAAAFWGLWLGKWQKNEGNGLRGFL